MNEATRALLRDVEASNNCVTGADTPDTNGLTTIGFGHLCKEDGCAEVQRKYSIPLSQADCENLLTDDLRVCSGDGEWRVPRGMRLRRIDSTAADRQRTRSGRQAERKPVWRACVIGLQRRGGEDR